MSLELDGTRCPVTTLVLEKKYYTTVFCTALAVNYIQTATRAVVRVPMSMQVSCWQQRQAASDLCFSSLAQAWRVSMVLWLVLKGVHEGE